MEPRQTPIPPPEKNKLQQALDDYGHLENERDHLQRQVIELSELSSKIVAENEALKDRITEQANFFTKHIEGLNVRNARLNALSKGLLTRFKMIRECFEAAELEAIMESVNPEEKKPAPMPTIDAPLVNDHRLPVEPEIAPEDEQTLVALGFGDAERRPAESRLPVNSYPR